MVLREKLNEAMILSTVFCGYIIQFEFEKYSTGQNVLKQVKINVDEVQKNLLCWETEQRKEEMDNQEMQLGNNLLSQTQLNQKHILNKSWQR